MSTDGAVREDACARNAPAHGKERIEMIGRTTRGFFGLLVAALAAALVAVGAGAVTYDGVDALPEPDLLLEDRAGDLVYGSSGSWEDIREVSVFVEEAFLAFAITCRGSAPRGGMLFVLLDMDGDAGPISTRGGVNRDDVRRAGYEFELGLVHDDEGLYRVRDWTPRSVATIGHWSERGTSYYEVAWEHLGGRPEGTIDFMVLTFGSGFGAGHDVAPNHGAETLDVLAVTEAAQNWQTVFETSFDGSLLEAGWRWVREDRSHWTLEEHPGFLTITTQWGELGSDSNSTRNLLLRDAPDGDFEITTRVEFLPTEDFQFAGLLIYDGDDNFASLERGYCSPEYGGCAGNAIYFYHEHDGELEPEFNATSMGRSSAYLRIVRRGSTYRGYYSEDGEAWIETGTHTTRGFTPTGVGLYAGNCETDASEIPAHFDYFVIRTSGG